MVLPMATRSRMYMNGTVRSWIHYLELRTSAGTQKEHRDVAFKIRELLAEQMPVVAKAMGWDSDSASGTDA